MIGIEYFFIYFKFILESVFWFFLIIIEGLFFYKINKFLLKFFRRYFFIVKLK